MGMDYNAATLIIAIITLLTVIIGTTIAIIQWIKNSALQRTKFVHEVLSKFQYEKTVAETIYLVMDKNAKINNELKKVDKLLVWLTYVCYLMKTKCISYEESSMFENTLYRVLKSNAVKDYLMALNRYSNTRKIRCTYYHLIRYGLDHKLLCEEDFKMIEFPQNK